jgi:iron complex transport system permease protein
MQSNSKKTLLFSITLLALLIMIFLPSIGIKNLDWSSVFNSSNNMDSSIYWNIRIPRTLLGFFAGAGLALSGMVFQSIFKNALATPYTLGVASGASLGASIYIHLGSFLGLSFASSQINFFGFSPMSLAAFIGAGLSVLFIFSISTFKQNLSTASLLLTGVTLNLFFSSFILFLQYLSDYTQSFQIIRWLMGGLEVIGMTSVYGMGTITLIGSLVIFRFSQELNLLSLGEDVAHSRGVNLLQTKIILFIVTSIMIASIISITGPIGFVGMIIPHLCRQIIGSDHRFLAPMSFIVGGVFLSLCDSFARIIISPTELPVGIITAMLGGPFFLWILIRKN